jgi:hypothetical protein
MSAKNSGQELIDYNSYQQHMVIHHINPDDGSRVDF